MVIELKLGVAGLLLHHYTSSKFNLITLIGNEISNYFAVLPVKMFENVEQHASAVAWS